MDIDSYCILSSLKITVARFHTEKFEELLSTGSGWGDDPESRIAPYHAHADGAVFEMFAAFDTFSCAAAHKLGLKGADDYSFKRLVSDDIKSKVPADLRQRLQETVDTEEWQRLESLRHLAGHRGVVSERFRWPNLRVFLPDDDEALPVLKRLLRWSEERLRFLFPSVCEIAFSTQDQVRQLRGSEVRTDVRPADKD